MDDSYEQKLAYIEQALRDLQEDFYHISQDLVKLFDTNTINDEQKAFLKDFVDFLDTAHTLQEGVNEFFIQCIKDRC